MIIILEAGDEIFIIGIHFFCGASGEEDICAIGSVVERGDMIEGTNDASRDARLFGEEFDGLTEFNFIGFGLMIF